MTVLSVSLPKLNFSVLSRNVFSSSQNECYMFAVLVPECLLVSVNGLSLGIGFKGRGELVDPSFFEFLIILNSEHY